MMVISALFVFPVLFTDTVSANGYSTVLRPNADGSPLTWDKTSEDYHYQEVDEVGANDTGTTTVYTSTNAESEYWYVESPSESEQGIIDNVTMHVIMSTTHSGDTFLMSMTLPEYAVQTTSKAITAVYPGCWQEYTWVVTEPPADAGGPWAWSDFEDLEIGIRSTATAGTTYCTQAWIEVFHGANPNQTEVWVDDDYNAGTPGWGNYSFATIETASVNLREGGTMNINAGTYSLIDEEEGGYVPSRNNIHFKGAGADVVTITGDEESEGSIFYLSSQNNITISGINFTQSGYYGTIPAINIESGLVSNTNIYDCMFFACSGVAYTESFGNYVWNCTFKYGASLELEPGLWLSPTGILIVSGSQEFGGFQCSNISVLNCLFIDYNGSGIVIAGSGGNVIQNCIFNNSAPFNSDTEISIGSISTSSACMVIDGEEEANSGTNDIYYNQFYLSTDNRSVADHSSQNLTNWDDESRGNYYDHYDEDEEEATDANGDGIVDIPYIIPGDAVAVDYFPSRSTFQIPSLINEKPVNETTAVSSTIGTVNITITVVGLFDWSIGGDYITTTSGTDETSGEKTAVVNSPLPSTEEIEWWVNASNTDGYVNETFLFTTEPTYADIIYVDDDYTVATEGWHVNKYDTITEALNAVNEDGTVYVYEGEYAENIAITQTMNIIGVTGAYYSGRDSIILDGDASGNVIAISANYVNVSGLTIKDGDNGIYLSSADYVQIKGNIIKDNAVTGITFLNSDETLIKENDFNTSGIVIDDSDSDYIAIYHNNFYNSTPDEEGGGTGNTWNLSYPYGGNYYEGYSATYGDVYQGKGQNISGSDGLGDHLWNPGRDGTDYYPLFSPYVLGNQRPYVYNPIPIDNIEDVLATTSSVRIDIEDIDGDSFDWYFETSPDVGSASSTGASNGTKILPLTTPLPYFTEITWYVNVTDGIGWTNTTHVFKTESYMYYLYPGSSTPVQDAIDAASPGDTVNIYKGYFTENVVISKSIILIGEDVDETTIDADDSGDVISITTNNVTVQNLNITNSGATGVPDFDSGIDIRNHSQIQLIGNNIHHNKYGIHIEDARGNEISNNSIDSNTLSGIYATRIMSSKFFGNSININGAYAIYFSSCSLNDVQNNTITQNVKGIYSHTNGSGNIYTGNTISANEQTGIWLEIENGAIIAENMITSNMFHGILLYNAFPETMTCDGNIITNNVIASNLGIGIWLHGASENTICRNNISGNNNKGIDIYWESKENDIYENDIRGFDYINNISGKQDIGLLVRPGVLGEESCDNFIYHNNFYGNVVQMTDSESTESTFSYNLRPNDDEGTNEWEGSDDDGYSLNLKDAEFEDNRWTCGDGTYVYSSCGIGGIKAYTFDGESLELIGTWEDRTDSLSAKKMWCDGTYIFGVWGNMHLRAFTFDGANFHLITTFKMEYESDGIWGDGTYIYVAQKTSGFSVYSFDGSQFELMDEWSASEQSEYGNYVSIWGDGTYIYSACVELDEYVSELVPVYHQQGWHTLRAQEVIRNAKEYIRSISQYIPGVSDTYYTGLVDPDTLSWSPHGISQDTILWITKWSYTIMGYRHTRIQHDNIRAFTFDGANLDYKAGLDIGSKGCNSIHGDGTYLYAACSQNLRAYTFNGTSFTFRGTQEMGDSHIDNLWSDEVGNVYVTSKSGADLSSSLSVYTLDGDGRNFTLKDRLDDEIFGENAVWGNGNNLYLGNSFGIFAFLRYGGISHYRLVNEKIIDDAAEYVYCLSSTSVGSKELYDVYNFISAPSVNYGDLESVTVTAYVNMPTAAGASGSFDLIISDGTNEQTDHHDITLGASWLEYTSTFVTSPSGAAWDWDDLTNLKIGLSLGAGVYVDSQPKMTQMYLDFNYIKEQYNVYNDSYPSGGNYFDDLDEESEGAYDRYSGPNQDIPGADGIVDGNSPNPYEIPGTAASQDNYPLLHPYSSSVTADFDFTPANPMVDQTVSFISKSSGYIVSEEWNFGDGTATKGSTVSHAFRLSNFYTVTLKVTDVDGNTDSKSRIVPVGTENGPIVIPPLQPPKYPNNPFTIPEMYQLLRANVVSDSKVTIVAIDSGNYPQIYDDVDLSPVINVFHSSYPDGIDTFGHGTWVNYAIRYGIQEYCPNAVQYSIRAFDGTGQSTPETFLACLDMAKDLNPDIVTISAGIIGTADDVFSKKVGELRRAGIFVTVSAGNSGPGASTVTSPAAGVDSIAIGATDPMQPNGVKSIIDLSDDEVAEWSSRGPIAGIFPKPDFTAPGESIIGPWLDEDIVASGTSMAAPLIASSALQVIASNKGILDAVRFIYGNKIYLDIIETSLMDSSYDKGDRNSYGWGIPNTQSAVGYAWLKAVWYIIIFIISIIILSFFIFILWRYIKGGRKKLNIPGLD